MKRRVPLLVGLVALAAIPTIAALWLAATSADDDATILVLAPSSLAPLQDDLDARLADHGITDVEWLFAGSQTLVAQLADGAPADVLLTADRHSFDDAIDRGLGWPDQRFFASNHLVLATPPGNPAGITSTDALADPGLLIGVCAADVPCGRLAAQATGLLGISVDADTEETSARALTAKLTSGELDAGLVYLTDAATAGLDVVEPDAFADTRSLYWGTANDHGKPVLDVLVGPGGTAILIQAGFGS